MAADRFFTVHKLQQKIQHSGAKARSACQRIYVAAKAATHKSHLKLGCVQQWKTFLAQEK
jgi:hypothetical protein